MTHSRKLFCTESHFIVGLQCDAVKDKTDKRRRWLNKRGTRHCGRCVRSWCIEGDRCNLQSSCRDQFTGEKGHPPGSTYGSRYGWPCNAVSMFQNVPASPNELRQQMRGRAGRKGKDELGESYICCQKEDLEEVEQLLEADLPPITSSLSPGRRGLKR